MDSWNTEFREVFAVAYPFLKETFLPESGNVAYGEKTTTEIAEDILEKIRADESRVANVFQTKKEVTRGLVGTQGNSNWIKTDPLLPSPTRHPAQS